MQVWVHWNHCLDTNLRQLGPVSCIFTSWASSGLTSLHWKAIIADDCDILVYLYGRKISFLDIFISHHEDDGKSPERDLRMSRGCFKFWGVSEEVTFDLRYEVQNKFRLLKIWMWTMLQRSWTWTTGVPSSSWRPFLVLYAVASWWIAASSLESCSWKPGLRDLEDRLLKGED